MTSHWCADARFRPCIGIEIDELIIGCPTRKRICTRRPNKRMLMTHGCSKQAKERSVRGTRHERELGLGYAQNVHASYQISARHFECFSACIQRYEICSGPSYVLFIDVGNQNHSLTNHSPEGGSYQKSSAPATFGYRRHSSRHAPSVLP